jgi:LCP family protein required for cell wall assembly
MPPDLEHDLIVERCATVRVMPSVRETWRAMGNASRIGSVVLAAAVVSGTVGGGYLALRAMMPSSPVSEAGEVEPTAVPPGTSLPPLPPAGSPGSLPATPSLAPGADPLLGTDGRFTVLLLGTDYRPAHPGNRTDAIMVVSVDPSTGQAAAFSIPRDTTAFPLPDGTRFTGKVNALYAHLQATEGDGGPAMKAAVAKAFGIELDGYVFIGFSGVKSLVAAVGGVDVFLDRAYYDPEYWVTSKQQGWGLPAGRSHLSGTQALIFARSRKGDNDFGRARRQQILVGAALNKVRTLGPGVVPTLLRIAHDTVRTDLPLARAADLFNLIETVDLEHAAKVVFGPTVYADGLGGSTFALNLSVDRKWIARNFPPERPFAGWPAKIVTPTD